MRNQTEIKEVIDYFVRGECYCSRKPETQIHDYDAIKHLTFGSEVGGRTDEFFVYDANPANVLEFVNRQGLKTTYWLTVFSDEKPGGYESEDYTVKSEEFLMNLDLDNVSFETGNRNIKRVRTEEEAQRINDYYGKEAIKKLEDPNMRYFVGEEEGEPASRGSYALIDNVACLDNVFTAKTHRGKGLANALCQTMLMDAKQEGARESILVSSQMGHALYLKLGYQDVSKMWVFERNLNPI